MSIILRMLAIRSRPFNTSSTLCLQQMQAKLRCGARALARSQRGFRTPQVESAVPLGPLDLGKMRLSQTREMLIRLHDDLLFQGRTRNVTCQETTARTPCTGNGRCTMKTNQHLPGLAQTYFSEVKWSKGSG